MSGTIGQRELRDDTDEILRRVEAGESVVVTRDGRPVVGITPHAATGKRRMTVGELQIAATAGAARLPLVTCNPDDFVGADRLVDIVAVSRPTA